MRALLLALTVATPLTAQDVVVLGETHDNPGHHIRQAGELVALSPRAVVFEMLTSDQAARIESRTPDAIRAATGWDDSGWPEFPLYAPVFAALGEAQIFGGGLDRALVRQAITDGAAAVLDDPRFDLSDLPEEEQATREAEQQEAHCNALPEEMLPGMVEAQRLRDAALTRAVLTAIDETGGPVALITGNGHARKDRAVPLMLARVAPDLVVDVLGQFEEMPEEGAPFDRWAISPAPEREDPCAAFQ